MKSISFVESLFESSPTASQLEQLHALLRGHELMLRVAVITRLCESREQLARTPLPFEVGRIARPSFGTWLELAIRIERQLGRSEVLPSWHEWLVGRKGSWERLVRDRNDLVHGALHDVAPELERARRAKEELFEALPYWHDVRLVGARGAFVHRDQGPDETLRAEPPTLDNHVRLVRGGHELDLHPFLAHERPLRDGRRGPVPRLQLFGGIDARGRGLDMDVLAARAGEPVRSWQPIAELAQVERLFSRGDWVERETPYLHGRSRLLLRATEQLLKHCSGAPLLVEGSPGAGKTAMMAGLARSLRQEHLVVVAYAPRHASKPGLEGFRQAMKLVQDFDGKDEHKIEGILAHARDIRDKRGRVIFVIDAVDEASNRDELRALASRLASDGHTVVVSCRSPLSAENEWPRLLVQADLALSEESFAGWIRESVASHGAQESLSTESGRRWVRQVYEQSEGLALYVAVLVERLRDGTIAPGDPLPSLEDEWNRMLDDAGALDDEGSLAPALLVAVCQLPHEYVMDELLEVVIGAPLAPILERLRDFLRNDPVGDDLRSLAPYHALLRRFVLETPRLARTRDAMRARWLDTVFGAPVRGDHLIPFAHFAARLQVAREAWEKFVTNPAFLERVAFHLALGSEVDELSSWAAAFHEHEVPPSLLAWLDLVRSYVEPPRRGMSLGDCRAFLVDRVREQPENALVRRVLDSIGVEASRRPCTRAQPPETTATYFRFPGEPKAVALGEEGKYLAVVTDDGTICVGDVALGRGVLVHPAPELNAADGNGARSFEVAVSDRVRRVAACGTSSSTIVVSFGEDPPAVRHYPRGQVFSMGPLPLPETVLAHLEGEPDLERVDERARSRRIEQDGRIGFEQEPLGLSAYLSTTPDYYLHGVELYRDGKIPEPWNESDLRLLAVGDRIAVAVDRSLSVYDLDGQLVQRVDLPAHVDEAGPDGIAQLATEMSDRRLLRIESAREAVELRDVGAFQVTMDRGALATGGEPWVYDLTEAAKRSGMVWVSSSGERRGVWRDPPPGGIEVAIEDPSGGLARHIVVRNDQGVVIADWWSGRPLEQAVMITPNRVAVLECGSTKPIVLAVDVANAPDARREEDQESTRGR